MSVISLIQRVMSKYTQGSLIKCKTAHYAILITRRGTKEQLF